MDYKIFEYLDKLTDAYKEPVKLLDGLIFDFKDTLRTIEFYSNNQYLTGNKDELGKEKPFYNVGNYRVTTAKTATDLDVKDIKYEPDSLNDSVPAMIINHELYKVLKEINFSETLNDMGFARPKYGELLVSKDEKDGKLDIVVEAWKNIDADPAYISKAPIIKTHYLQPSELAEMTGYWDDSEVKDFMKAHTKAHKGKIVPFEVKELIGELSVSYYPDQEENEKNDMTFKRMCFYIGIVNKKKYLLYYEYEKENRFKNLPWEKRPGAPGKGIIELGFEDQVWSNDLMISAKNATNLSTKILLATDSNKVSGNAITGVDNGHIFELEPGRSITPINLGPSKLPEIEKLLNLWDIRYNKEASTYDANTGEAPTAGTPYSQTALLNQVANSPFEYQREVWGIFLNEILNDWILPYLKKRIMKPHYLVSEFSAEELELIDKDIKTKTSNQMIKDKFLQGTVPTEEDRMMTEMGVEQGLKQFGSKREIDISDGYLDIDGKITANITGELKNKAVILQSMAQIGKDIMATYNPNTNTYAAMEDPFLRELYRNIVELSGMPIMSGKLQASQGAQTSPVQQQDLSAVAPAQPIQ
jgi:hypothetical protein